MPSFNAQWPPKERVVPIDAARGMAMFFSCLAHFARWIQPTYPRLSQILYIGGMIATPTFLLLSGSMVGLLSMTSRQEVSTLRNNLFNRGLFLLTFGHFAIALSESHLNGGTYQALKQTFSTDSIGLGAMIAALWLMGAPYRRLGHIALGSYLLAWTVAIAWHPMSPVALFLKELLIGGTASDLEIASYQSPFVEYVAIYLCGIPFGYWLGKRIALPDGLLRAGQIMIRFGLGAVLLAVALRITRFFVDHSNLLPQLDALDLSLSISQKLPPSPNYLLFYGGCGITIAGSIFVNWHAHRLTDAIHYMSDIGRASFFIFVLQYFTLWTVPDLLGMQPGPSSWLVLLGNLFFLWIAARLWNASKGNRLMTLGIRLDSRKANRYA